MGCGSLVEAEEYGAKDTGEEDKVRPGWALVGSVEPKETNPSRLEG